MVLRFGVQAARGGSLLTPALIGALEGAGYWRFDSLLSAIFHGVGWPSGLSRGSSAGWRPVIARNATCETSWIEALVRRFVHARRDR